MTIIGSRRRDGRVLRPRLVWLLVPAAVLAAVAMALIGRDRVVRVRLAATQVVRARPDWQAMAAARLRTVSQLYSQTSGVRFDLADAIAWDVPDDLDLDAARERLKSDVPREGVDLLLALVGPAGTSLRLGSTVPFASAAVVVDFPDRTEAANAAVLAHELGHLFGAVHVASTSSVMHETASASSFDLRSARVLRTTRNIDFAAGLGRAAPTVVADLEARYAKALGFEAPADRAKVAAVIAESLRADGHQQPAIEKFRDALRLNPDDTGIRVRFAQVLEMTGDTEGAMTELERVLRSAPDDVNAHNRLGMLLALRDPERAEREFEAVIRLRPDEPAAYVNLASVLAPQFGALPRAIAALRKAERLAPQSSAVRTRLEEALAEEQRLETEVLRLRARVAAQPTDSRARFDLATMALRAGHHPEAIGQFRALLQQEPNHAEAHHNLAVACYASGQFETARRELDLARSLGATPRASFVSVLAAAAQQDR